MTEEEAQAWLAAQPWYDEQVAQRLYRFVDLVLDEADRQNLISSGSRAEIWARHIVDSAQLLSLADKGASGLWIDLGTGAGFPGLVVACLRPSPIMLVEMRPLRAAFLHRCIETLALPHAEVRAMKVERVVIDQPAAVISARAYAPLDRLLSTASHLGDSTTMWLLPKGRNAMREVDALGPDWEGVFHVEQSITDPESAILVGEQVRRKYPVRKPMMNPKHKSTAHWRGR